MIEESRYCFNLVLFGVERGEQAKLSNFMTASILAVKHLLSEAGSYKNFFLNRLNELSKLLNMCSRMINSANKI